MSSIDNKMVSPVKGGDVGWMSRKPTRLYKTECRVVLVLLKWSYWVLVAMLLTIQPISLTKSSTPVSTGVGRKLPVEG